MKNICLALALLCASVSLSQAQVFNCTLSPTSGYSGMTPTEMRIDLDASPGRLLLSDNVAPKVGRQSVNGKINRYVGNDMLFNWQLSSIPQALKPPTERKFYEGTINYSGRLNQATGAISIVGHFVTRVSSANTGLNMRARGRCE